MGRKSTRWRAGWAVVVAATAMVAPARGDFLISDLGVLPGGMSSQGKALNANGLAAGSASTASGASHAVTAGGSGPPSDLGVLAGGTNSYGLGIDGSGRVAGYGDVGVVNGQTVFHAFRSMPGGGLVDFGVGGIVNAAGQAPVSSFGTAINAGGTVVGYVSFQSTQSVAFKADSANALTSLGTLGGQNSAAYGINASGTIVGQSDTASGFSVGFIYNGSMQSLGLLSGGTTSSALSINKNGTAVGYADSFGTQYAVETGANGTWQVLGTKPGGVTPTVARSINDSGDIVGQSGSGTAFYYDHNLGYAVDLNSLIHDSSWVLVDATSINNAGDIVGYGYHTIPGVGTEERGFLLTPAVVPEPASALILATGGLILLARRFRRG